MSEDSSDSSSEDGPKTTRVTTKPTKSSSSSTLSFSSKPPTSTNTKPPTSSSTFTPEEAKKQKERDRKKSKRKKKRTQLAISRKDGDEEDEDEDGEETKVDHPLTVSETLKVLKEEGAEPPKKRVYGVQIDKADIPKPGELEHTPAMEKFARSVDDEKNIPEMVLVEPAKQHRGLRCSRCFALLCRDDDFEYMNGQLNVTGEALKPSWDGLIIKGGMVYCQKMHLVGYRKHVTFTNLSRNAVILKVEKTTFTDNYVKNPAFAGSEKIRNRLQFQERGGNDGMWRQLSLPPEAMRPKELAPADRYHDQIGRAHV